MTDSLPDADDLVMQDRVLVEADTYGKLTAFRAVVVKVCPDEVWLGLGAADRRLEILREDQPVALTVARAKGALVGKSRFLRPLGGSRSRIFAIGRPLGFEWVQRRAHLRFEVPLQFHFRCVDPQTKVPRGKASNATTLNLSSGGLLLITDAQVKVGDEIEITLPFSSLDRVTTAGVVTRIHTTDEIEGQPAAGEGAPLTEAAVKFTRITSVDQQRILRFVTLLEHRRQAAPVPPMTLPAPLPTSPAAPSQPGPNGPPIAHAADTPARTPAPKLSVTPASRPSTAATPREGAAPAASEVTDPHTPISLDSRRPAGQSASETEHAGPGEPLTQIGWKLLERGGADAVRHWFDRLDPPLRIELLSQLQAGVANATGSNQAAAEDIRGLARALGLLPKEPSGGQQSAPAAADS